MDKQIFKVITPIEKRGGGHYWMRLGSAYRNKDNSINVYLDAIPKGPNLQFQLRELDDCWGPRLLMCTVVFQCGLRDGRLR